ncbi:hypothetical protein TNCV_3889821 [Trichonephila clavipes]|nr:hypothetical protein TNCV_3889821 [Trichonephila clavipes]
MLPVLRKKAVLEWCMKEGLIGSSYVCLKCGKSMELRERTDFKRRLRYGVYGYVCGVLVRVWKEEKEQISKLSEIRKSFANSGHKVTLLP